MTRLHAAHRPVLFGACLALVMIVGSAVAQPPPADTSLAADLAALLVEGGLTADQAAQRASKESPAVARKLAELEGSLAAVSSAELQRVPRLSAQLSYTRLSSLAAPDLGPGITFPVLLDAYGAEAQIVVPLSDYLVRHPEAIRAARTSAEAARVAKRATELDAATAARLAYYEWIRARLQVVTAQRQLTQVRAALTQVRALTDAQRLPRADLLRVESQEASAEQVLDRLRTVAALREDMLRLQIGARSDETLAIGEDLRVAITPPTDAKGQRLDLQGLELAIDSTEQRRSAERANLLPSLSAFATLDYANPNARVFPQDDQLTLTWAAGAQLTWSLNDALLSRTTSRRLAAEAKALRADREQLERAVRIEVLAAQQSVDNAQRAIVSSNKGLIAAEEGYRVRRAFLDAERVTAVELVDAETELMRARIVALDARIDLRIAIAELIHATGADTH